MDQISDRPDNRRHDARPATRRRAVLAAVPMLALIVASATAASAQTFPGGGGPFATGSVTSVSGSTVDLKSATGGDDVTVTLSDSTTYVKNEAAATSAIEAGTCVRVSGTGSAAKGIKATTVAITPMPSSTSSSSTTSPSSGSGSAAGGCGGGGFGNRPGFGNRGGSGQPPGANGNGTGSAPSGSNGNRPPGGANARRRLGGIAFGSVVSITGDQMVVKARTLAGRPKRGTTPKLKTEKVKVTLSDSTKITQTVAGTVGDVAVGKCLTAIGSGDATAVTADRVTISDPVDGACTAGFGGGGFPGGGGGGTGAPQATT
jgi:hypothetical protein